MYWIKKSKKYDPLPYNRLLRIWHKLVGCPIGSAEFVTEYHWASVKVRHHRLECQCGNTYIYEE
jgi:hypothetical protein